MSKVAYPKTSPYSDTPQTSWYLSRYVHREIAPATDDTIVEITKGYEFRPDKMSFDLYGTEAYWWVFMSRNLNILRDPIWDFKTGLYIYAPSLVQLRGVV